MPESPDTPYQPTPYLVRNSPEGIADFLLYGDIEEMPFSILGENAPTIEQLDAMNDEQRIRHACAACVIAWLQGRLTIGGHYVEAQHQVQPLEPQTAPPGYIRVFVPVEMASVWFSEGGELKTSPALTPPEAGLGASGYSGPSC